MNNGSKVAESIPILVVDIIRPAHTATHASRQNRDTSGVNVAAKARMPIAMLSRCSSSVSLNAEGEETRRSAA